MNTIEFKNKLKELMDGNSDLRPFVCDGNPLESEIFIVGINPATTIDSNFWGYYKDEKFDKNLWMRDYEMSRKDKRTKLSPTRSKIEHLIKNDFSNYLCLETNIYSKPTKTLNQLTEDDKNFQIFEFLLNSIKPKALLIHGKDPADFIKNELSIRFGLNKTIKTEYQTINRITPLEIEWQYGKICICATRHFRLIKMSEISDASKGLIKMMNNK